MVHRALQRYDARFTMWQVQSDRSRSRTMIYVIRHGQTELNNAHALQGRSDHPLNEVGVAQAREVGKRLADRGVVFSHVFSSPLQRAMQTAQLVAPDAQVVVDKRLIEMDYGPYEGADLKCSLPSFHTSSATSCTIRLPRGWNSSLRWLRERGHSSSRLRACLAMSWFRPMRLR